MCEHTFVRWDNLTIEAQEGTALPGYREPAIVRHFDAPEALDTRFYEVRAKSALNRVPERSRMPFRWTINPYRGCSHACLYCSWGETPILMADGRTRLLAHLSPGDRIVGTEVRGRYRRYVTTEVLAHWSTIKPAYRVTLEDGTELIASGDHRFLTNRGWKFVTGAYGGPGQRPHLTTNNELLGTGRFAAAPSESSDYRRGYLCGIVRGDGHIGSYSYCAPTAGRATTHRFRLALCRLTRRCGARTISRSRSGVRDAHRSSPQVATGARRAARRSARPRDDVDAHRGSSSLAAVAATTTGARASWRGSSTPRAPAPARGAAHRRTPTG